MTTAKEKNVSVVGRRSTLPSRPRVGGQAAIAVLVILVAMLVGLLLFLNSSQRVEVLAVKDRVPVGQTLTRGDLVAMQVAGVQGAIPLTNADEVIGKTTTTTLVARQIITADMISDQPVPGPGQALLGVALSSAQMPGDGLEPGDSVRVVSVPARDTGGEEPTGSVLVDAAQVYAVTTVTDGDASRQVTLLVPAGDADKATRYAAAGRVAIVKISPVEVK